MAVLAEWKRTGNEIASKSGYASHEKGAARRFSSSEEPVRLVI
jgi:hypothetical protein